MRLRNKVALVTGAASGFGAEIARLFAAEGALVAVVDLNEAGARSISTEIGNAASPIKCDVAVGPEVRNAVETTQEIFGRLDIVVNNAGTTHRNKPMLEVTEAEFDKVYAVNASLSVRMISSVTDIPRSSVHRAMRAIARAEAKKEVAIAEIAAELLGERLPHGRRGRR
jgi:3-oxoacyl-[acyl-carrier protein] reductase